MWSKVRDFFAGTDADDDYDDVAPGDEPRRNVVLFPESKSGRCRGVSIFHPRRFDEVTEIADNLRGGRHVVVNLVGRGPDAQPKNRRFSQRRGVHGRREDAAPGREHLLVRARQRAGDGARQRIGRSGGIRGILRDTPCLAR